MKLAPHDAELIEADARELYETWRRDSDDAAARTAPGWEKAAEPIRRLCRGLARNPYGGPR